MLPPPMPIAPAIPVPAQQLHEQRSKRFVQDAITDFHRGGITRKQLADAISDEDAYDFGHWKRKI